MTASQPKLRSVTAPKQARSEATLNRLLDAAESLIEEKGLAALSIPEIVRRARSSVGGFYARFRDKDELLRALEERFLTQLQETLDTLSSPTRWSGISIAEIAKTCIGTLVEIFRERQPLIAAIMVRASLDPNVLEEGLRFRQRVSAQFVDLLRGRKNQLQHPNPEVAVDLGIQFAFGLMHQKVMFGEVRAAGKRISDRQLVEELTRNFLAYVGYRESLAGTTA